MSISETDAKAAAVAVGPRVTERDIENEIESGTVHVFANVLTIAILTLKNGYIVTGESAAASPENFNRALGEEIATKKAKEKIWPLLGFRLRDRLSVPPNVDESTSDDVARLAAIGIKTPHLLSLAEVQSVCASALTQVDAGE